MHKTAGELKPGDTFIMAGVHYDILEIYETNDDQVIKVAFTAVIHDGSIGRFMLIIDKRMLFVTI